MKRIFTTVVMALAIVLISCTSDDGVMTKKKGVYTVNTTTLSENVKGYNGPTPLIVTIENDKIVKVEALMEYQNYIYLTSNLKMEKYT